MGRLDKDLVKRRIIYLVRLFWFPFERNAKYLNHLSSSRNINEEDNHRFRKSSYGPKGKHSKLMLRVIIDRYFEYYFKCLKEKEK